MTSRGKTAAKLEQLSESWIREMTRIALECGAINLSQGYPDFDPPREVREAAAKAVLEGPNQYAITWGLAELREAIAGDLKSRYAPQFDWLDPDLNITITCGVTEGIVAALMAIADPGDEVIIIEPAHENYTPAVRFAGAKPVYVPLLPPHYALDIERLEAAVTTRSKAVILNTPHNPSGRVLGREELDGVARICIEHDLVAVTDEIYDRILYDGREHIPLATLPEMDKRTITVGGLSKTFAITGWRLGFFVAREPWATGTRTVHDFTTICAPTPLQAAGAAAYSLGEEFYARQLDDYHARRDLMMEILPAAGFTPAGTPEGAYYIMAGYEEWGHPGESNDFALWLAKEVGVAVVGGSHFYHTPGLGEREVRFAFAKKLETLEEARDRLLEGIKAKPRGKP
ncbi:MAG: aminotransferase [Planctomycetes bacterium]|nr:aminotransferase [Planctomycetota bacterium]